MTQLVSTNRHSKPTWFKAKLVWFSLIRWFYMELNVIINVIIQLRCAQMYNRWLLHSFLYIMLVITKKIKVFFYSFNEMTSNLSVFCSVNLDKVRSDIQCCPRSGHCDNLIVQMFRSLQLKYMYIDIYCIVYVRPMWLLIENIL